MNPLNSPHAGRHTEVPAGTADLLPEAAAKLIRLRRTLLDTLTLWGYRPVAPPLIEHAEVFARAQPEGGEELSSYKIVDRTTGHMLCLRADFTPQIARLAATRFTAEALPLRLCYDGPVVRHVPAQRGKRRELYQIGAELLGVSDPEGDAETIAVAVEGLRKAGLTAFKLDVGQVEFFKGVLADAGLSPADTARLTDAVARKDVTGLEEMLGGMALADGKKRLLAALPMLAGGTEVLDRAGSLAETDHSRRALENLARVVDFVRAQGFADALTVDLGEIRGVDYHSGVIFEAFAPQLGAPLLAGGRYDGLVAAYGAPLPATGFSIDLLAVGEALAIERPGDHPAPSGVYIINYLPGRETALSLARELRAAGVRTSRDLVRRPEAQSLAAATGQGFRWAVLLGAETLPATMARLVDLAYGARSDLPLAQAAARLKS